MKINRMETSLVDKEYVLNALLHIAINIDPLGISLKLTQLFSPITRFFWSN